MRHLLALILVTGCVRQQPVVHGGAPLTAPPPGLIYAGDCPGREGVGTYVQGGFTYSCGFVIKDIVAEPAYSEFVAGICNGNDDEECRKRRVDMYFARLSERYYAADFGACLNRCDAYPLECKTLVDKERKYIESHNDALMTRWKMQMKLEREESRLRAAEAELRRQQQVSDALVNFSRGFQRPTVHCTSQAIGGTVYTNCN